MVRAWWRGVVVGVQVSHLHPDGLVNNGTQAPAVDALEDMQTPSPATPLKPLTTRTNHIKPNSPRHQMPTWDGVCWRVPPIRPDAMPCWPVNDWPVEVRACAARLVNGSEGPIFQPVPSSHSSLPLPPFWPLDRPWLAPPPGPGTPLSSRASRGDLQGKAQETAGGVGSS